MKHIRTCDNTVFILHENQFGNDFNYKIKFYIKTILSPIALSDNKKQHRENCSFLLRVMTILCYKVNK